MEDDDKKTKEEEKEKPRRGFILPPTKDACPKGHIDWETVRGPTGGLIKRCRRCGAIDKSFVSKVVK
jgi:hypothetical protein